MIASMDVFMWVSFALFALGVAGIAASRHIIMTLMSAEIALSGAVVAAASIFRFIGGNEILPLLFTIWAIAATEAVAAVVFYRYMSKHEADFDVSRLSKTKE